MRQQLFQQNEENIMGIQITISDLDQMPSAGIRKVAGLINIIADYHARLEQEGQPTPQQFASGVTTNEMPVPTLVPTPPSPVAIEDEYDDHAPAVFAIPPAPLGKAPSGIEVDSEGLPWDGRIHAASRTQTQDGRWKTRRGTDEAVLQAVKRELQITMGITPTYAQALNQLTPTPPVMEEPALVEWEESEAEVPAAPFVDNVVPLVPPVSSTPETVSAGVVETASPIEASSSGMTFPNFMQVVTSLVAAKTLTGAKIQEAVVAEGLPSLPMLASRPDLIPGVATRLGITL